MYILHSFAAGRSYLCCNDNCFHLPNPLHTSEDSFQYSMPVSAHVSSDISVHTYTSNVLQQCMGNLSKSGVD